MRRLTLLAVVTGVLFGAILALAGCGGAHVQIGGTAHAPSVLAPKLGAEVHGSQLTSRLYSTSSLRFGAIRGQTYGGRTHSEGFGAPIPGTLTYSRAARTAVSILRGYDAVTAAYIPLHSQVAGCYASGPYANCSAVAARAPYHLLTIATYYGPHALALDVEPGDAVPSQAPGFVRYMHAAGVPRPWVYADAFHWTMAGGVRAYLSQAGFVEGRDYYGWMASWDGQANVPVGYHGHQFASGCCVDQDAFLASAFQAPKPPPKPKPKPTVVYNFAWFCHSKPASGLVCGPFSVPFNEGENGADSNNERSIYREYVTARAKPQTGGRVAYVAELKEEAHGLYARLVAASRHASKSFNDSLHRGGREAVLKAIYEGRANVSWSAVNG